MKSSADLTAIAGLLAVAGAGFFATRAVGTLFNHRSDLARIVPHPVSFSATPSTADASTPRSSISSDDHLRSRPLSPGSVEFVRAHQDRGTSPIPHERGIDRSTSMGSLATVSSVHESGRHLSEVDDDALSVTSAADGIDVASTISSSEMSETGSVDMMGDMYATNRELPADMPRFRSLSPEMIQKLPHELTVGTLRERAQLAMKAANTATEAAQR